MAPLRRVVADVLIPHDPELVDVADRVAAVEGVEGVNAALLERDREVQNVKLTVEGYELDLATIEDRVEELGGTVHSVDQVVCGERLVEEPRTPQD